MPRSKAKLRGRTTSYAFFIQACREEFKKNNPEGKVDFSSFSKECSEKWKVLESSKKKDFEVLAQKDKVRYEIEVKLHPELNHGNGKDANGKKRKVKKDPFAPKKPMSAYFWFSNEQRGKVKEENPDFGIGGVAKVLGKLWRELNDDNRRKYDLLASHDKQRYEKEMETYVAKQEESKRKGPFTVVQIDDDEEEEETESEEEEDD